jgi:hypothetical protein
LKECDSDGDLSSEFMNYVLNVLSDIDVNYETLSFLSKQELCSQFQAYQEYLIFNEKMENERTNTLRTQKSIFNNNTLPPSNASKGIIYKTFPLNHNGLPLIYTIELTGNQNEFSYFTYVYFANHDINSSNSSK